MGNNLIFRLLTANFSENSVLNDLLLVSVWHKYCTCLTIGKTILFKITQV